MKKYQLLLIVFVFWWSIICPPIGYPSETFSEESSGNYSSTQKEMQDDSLHFRFKYLTFLNKYLWD